MPLTGLWCPWKDFGAPDKPEVSRTDPLDARVKFVGLTTICLPDNVPGKYSLLSVHNIYIYT